MEKVAQERNESETVVTEKEQPKKQTRTSNEQILDAINDLIKEIGSIKKDIEELKVKTGSRDKPVMPPLKSNYNNDPGPWGNQQRIA